MASEPTSTAPETSRRCLAVILAAGEGTRMKSALPKVLHAVAGRSMLGHVIAAITAAGADRLAVVVGPDREDVAKVVRKAVPGAEIRVQAERRGTAHAVLAARDVLERAVADGVEDVIVAFGDNPLILPETFARLRRPLAAGAAIAVLGFEAGDPTGYGRLLMEGAELSAIREERDASPEERAVGLCNAGLMAIAAARLLPLLDRVGNENAKAEFYLTDIVAIAREQGLAASVVTAPEAEVMGVNDRLQLAAAEALAQERLRAAAMRDGATLLDPASVYLCHDTVIGRDVTVEPGVFFGPGVVVEDGAVIHAFSHLEGVRVGPGASVGPFARLRPGAVLGPQAKVGNFVEIKNTDLGAGAKVSHLTYLGDAEVGPNANIGAGTITCNYDGFSKYRTAIGENAFIGSNSSLVAPVTVGAGAMVGSGSVITEDVPDDALALGRGRQVTKPGWAAQFRLDARARRGS